MGGTQKCHFDALEDQSGLWFKMLGPGYCRGLCQRETSILMATAFLLIKCCQHLLKCCQHLSAVKVHSGVRVPGQKYTGDDSP